MSKPAADPAPRPTLATVHPEGKEISDKVGALCRRRDEIHVELQEIGQWLMWDNAIIFRGDREMPSAVIAPPKPTTPLRKSLLEKLGRFAPEREPKPQPDAEPPLPQVVYNDPLVARKVELAKELCDIEDALAILHPQLTRAHQQGSQKLCAALLPEYRTAVASRLASAMVALVEAVAAHDRFTHRIVMDGADPIFLRPLDIPALMYTFGDPRKVSFVRAWLAWGIQNGHISPDIVPAWWTEPAPVPEPSPVPRAARKVLPPTYKTIGGRVRLVPTRFADDAEGTRAMYDRIQGRTEPEAATILPGSR
jgi:hypothetical protein